MNSVLRANLDRRPCRTPRLCLKGVAWENPGTFRQRAQVPFRQQVAERIVTPVPQPQGHDKGLEGGFRQTTRKTPRIADDLIGL
jgi:hypothetical protein